MPTYQSNITYRGGFYNNKKVNGVDDRVYTAEDVRKPYDTVFSDGVMPNADGTAGTTLQVSSLGGMGISVAAGHAKIGGAWFENTLNYNITLDDSESVDRYDCVIIRNDDSEAVRAPSIYIKSQSTIPTVGDLVRSGDIYEICVAYVRVPAFATSISASNIVDTREDGSLCNVMSGVGATVVRVYRNTYFSTTTSQTVIPIGISQFNKTKDNLTVIVEGRVFKEGTQYTINNNSQITLSIGLPVVGTRIDFEVSKNVNAAAAETVVQEVGQLITQMTAVNSTLEHHYYCNGLTDNVNISTMAQTWLNGGNDNASMRLVVHGHFGVTAPVAGAGTSADRYKWFNIVKPASTNRKIILDFTDSTEITIPVTAATYNDIFNGETFDLVGVSVTATQTGAGTRIRAFSSTSGTLNVENCRISITSYQDSIISYNGTFTNCRCVVANTYSTNSYCFIPSNDGIVRLNGGTYYAYTGSSSAISAIVGQSNANAVCILYGVNAPTTARTGFYQTNSLIQYAGGGILNCTDMITTLSPIVVTGISNIRTTIAKNKPM